jgi:hypothetical protein
MNGRRLLGLGTMVAAAISLALPAGSAAKSLGGCPNGGDWQRVTVASLGITPEVASGIASLDGNGDGLTCIFAFPGAGPSGSPGAFIFRDNTVQGP